MCVSDAKVQKFRLARSARSQPLMGFSRVSGKFLVGINRHEQDHKNITSVKDTLYRQTMRFTNKILRS